MEQSTIAIIIVVLVMILYIMEIFPLAVTSMMAMAVMVAVGIIDWSQAFAGFSSSIVLMLIGVSIIGESFFTTELADSIGEFLKKFSALPDKYFSSVIYTVACAMSGFLNATAVMAIMMPVIDSLSYSTKNKVSRKFNYLPMGIGSIFGSNLTIVGSTSMYTAHVMLKNVNGTGMSFFEPAMCGAAACIAGLIINMTIGYRVQKKRFTLNDNSQETVQLAKFINNELNDEKKTTSKFYKKCIVSLTMVGCIVAFINGSDVGGVAITGAIIVMATRCISESYAYRGICWSCIFITASSIGFAIGVSESGAGKVIADFVIKISGSVGDSAFGMSVLILILSTGLSNFMSNIGVVVLLVPIVIDIAAVMETAALPFVIACAVGTNIAVATPICAPPITMTAAAGYRFKDYVIVGGLYNIIAVIVTILSLKFVYFFN